jgi:hypothetical protein
MSAATQINLFQTTALSTPLKSSTFTPGAALMELSVAAGAPGSETAPMSVRARNQASGFSDTIAALGGSATFTGTSRDASTLVGYSYFAANFYSDVAGTAFIEYSNDNTIWYPANGVAGTALAAGTNVALSARLVARYWRVRYVNGAGAQATFAVNSNFTLN